MALARFTRSLRAVPKEFKASKGRDKIQEVKTSGVPTKHTKDTKKLSSSQGIQSVQGKGIFHQKKAVGIKGEKSRG
jgi:pyruvate/2-oxoglutarate dehydrogenase complex dihydrolipoamide dehydrogenase (E3) component